MPEHMSPGEGEVTGKQFDASQEKMQAQGMNPESPAHNEELKKQWADEKGKPGFGAGEHSTDWHTPES